jgi:hypothetical protein
MPPLPPSSFRSAEHVTIIVDTLLPRFPPIFSPQQVAARHSSLFLFVSARIPSENKRWDLTCFFPSALDYLHRVPLLTLCIL